MNKAKRHKRKPTEKVTTGLEVIDKSEVSYVRTPQAAAEHDEENNSLSLYQPEINPSWEPREENNGVSLYQPVDHSTPSTLDNLEAASTAYAYSETSDFGGYSAVFSRNQVTGPGDQINGGLIEHQQGLALPDTRRVLWDCNTKPPGSEGNQVNGLEIVPCEDPTHQNYALDFSHLEIKGHYIGNTISGTGSQTNGFHIRRQELPKK